MSAHNVDPNDELTDSQPVTGSPGIAECGKGARASKETGNGKRQKRFASPNPQVHQSAGTEKKHRGRRYKRAGGEKDGSSWHAT